MAPLDGLRGLAIALVLWHHLVESALPPGRGSWLGWVRAGTSLSWCGVDLFFVLSGYFIGGILIDRRSSPRLARIFYLRRAVRILPLYYVTLAAAFAGIAAGLAGAGHLFPAWVYGLFLTNFALAASPVWDWLPLSALWSIAVEEQFYLIAPWVVRSIAPAQLPWFAAGLALLAWAARVTLVLVFPGHPLAAHVLMPLRMDTLALGVLVAWAVRHAPAQPFFAALSAHWQASLAGIGLVIALLTVQGLQQGDPKLCLYGYTLLATGFALLVALVAGGRPAGLNRLFAFRPLVHLGRHSYFVYLWHGLIGAGLIRGLAGEHFVLHTPAGATLVAGAVAVTWGAAILSWKLLESPLVALGQRHAY